MKPDLPLLALSAAVLFGLVSARAQSLYVHRELFMEGFGTSGTRTAAGLNNRGEVLYLYSSTNVTDGSAIPSLWLPKPNYGLPAGFTRLTNFQAVTRSPLPWFRDDGTFYTLVTDAKQGYFVYRGSAAGESLLDSQFSSAVSDFYYRQDLYAVTRWYIIKGITTQGQPFGDVQDNYPEIYSRLRGVFVGFPPGAPITSISMPIGPPGTPTTLASSPNGTVLVHLTGIHYLNFDNQDVPYGALGVVHSGSSRTISADPNWTGRTYPYVGADPGEPDPGNPCPFTVNDVGDAAGIDGAWGSLWFSPHTGGVIRAGRTNVSSVLLDKAGTVWFVSNFYQDIWRGDQQDFSPASSNRLHLPWITWGYTNVPTLAFVNDRGELLVHAQKTNNQTWAVLLSPKLSVALTVSTNHLSVGDSLTVTATVSGLGDAPLTGLAPNGMLTWSGTGALQIPDNPTPMPPLSLPPGGQTNFQWNCRATTNGSGQFKVAVQALSGTAPLISLPATSPQVDINLAADLMAKSVDPEDMVFLGEGQFQGVPFNDQNLTLPVGTNGFAGYVVRLVNSTKQARTFTLRGTTNEFPSWNLRVLVNTVDVLPALTGDGGWTTPELPVGGNVDLQVSFAPGPDAAIQEHKSLLIRAFADSGSAEVLDAVLLHATLVPVPVEVTIHRLTESGLTPASIQAGTSDINAPLEPASNPALLANQPLIHGGLVADGVTPLLLKLAADPIRLAQFSNGYAFDFQASYRGSGALGGDSLSQRLRVLCNGHWVAPTGMVLTAARPVAYVKLQPILSADVWLQGRVTEVQLRFVVADHSNGDEAGAIRFAVRKPPIALIHGYCTEGHWGADFKWLLGSSRPLGLEESPNNFIRTVRYGQDVFSDVQHLVGMSVYVNTVWPLADCAVLANGAFTARMAPLHQDWAFTRFDVVAHSQGGLLTRMLSSAAPNAIIRQPFRNPDNFYRGRFHRVVTIGSPHNGTRLLRYLLDLNKRGLNPLRGTPSTLIANLAVGLNVAQDKFDPFGDQIRELNDPSPGAPWLPDPAAPFHLVRATIDYGRSPMPGDLTPSYIVLSLTLPDGGVSVIPRGSDGVVDFDSMGAHGPSAGAAPNVFTLPADYLISHAGPLAVFAAMAAEVDSTDIAQHVIAALDEDQRAPRSGLVFGSFPLPPLLDDTQRALIDDFAAASLFMTVSGLIIPTPSPAPLAQHQTKDGGMISYKRQMTFPDNAPPQGNVEWFAEVFGPQGISTVGVRLLPTGANNRQVTVEVDNTVVGDVVLYATYLSTSNAVVSTTPNLVVSVPPADVSLVGLRIQPSTVSLPVGTAVTPQVVALYSDGTLSARYVTADSVTVTSSAPTVVSVADPLNWHLLSAGTAQVSLTWQGLTGISQITAFGTNATLPRLSLTLDGGDSFLLSWPAWASAFRLESNTNLANPTGWQPVTDPPTDAGGEYFLPLSPTNRERFYRLQSP